jgi:hypothetical protein
MGNQDGNGEVMGNAIHIPLGIQKEVRELMIKQQLKGLQLMLMDIMVV